MASGIPKLGDVSGALEDPFVLQHLLHHGHLFPDHCVFARKVDLADVWKGAAGPTLHSPSSLAYRGSFEIDPPSLHTERLK